MNQNSPSPRTFLIGALFAMTTTCIWSGWNVMSRMGVSESSLLPTDIVFLRYAVSGTLTLPFFIHFFRYYKTVPKHFLALMLFGSGFPYLWMACLGFSHAPASHGALIPGFMLLCVAVISALWLKEEISRLRKLGYGLIAATVLYRLITHSDGLEYLLADGWFICAGGFWAIYTVVNKRTGISPLAALGWVSSGSALLYCPLYLLFVGNPIGQLPPTESLMQMGYQGVMVGFIAFFCYNMAIRHIGPSRASAFTAAIPLLTILFSWLVLSEVATPADWWFAGLLTVGVLLSTGALRRLLEFRKIKEPAA
jgi:drug/metabolite transporter (DMT)-like permease